MAKAERRVAADSLRHPILVVHDADRDRRLASPARIVGTRVAFTDHSGLPIAITLHPKGTFREERPLPIGPHGASRTQTMFEDAGFDAAITIGTSLGEMETTGADPRRWCDIRNARNGECRWPAAARDRAPGPGAGSAWARAGRHDVLADISGTASRTPSARSMRERTHRIVRRGTPTATETDAQTPETLRYLATIGRAGAGPQTPDDPRRPPMTNATAGGLHRSS
jgi:hypothetical protein